MNIIDITAEKHAISQRIARRLKERREEMQLSQENVAECIGVSLQEIQDYEQARCSMTVETMEVLCQVLGTPIDYFFTDTPFDLALPPREFGLVEAWRALDEKHREMLEELAYVLAMHGKEG